MEKTTYLYLITKFWAKARPATVFALTFFLFALFNFSNSFAFWIERSSSYSLPPVMVPCNTDLPVPFTNSDFTGLEVSKNTTGVCSIILGCSLQNEENLIDGSETNYATARTLLGLGVTHTLRVTDNTLNEFYIGGSYAGFLIENTSVLQANLLNNIVIRTYLDGALQESNSGSSLAAINTTLLGANKYYAGFYTTQNFDAIEISISSFLGVASTTRVYHAVTNNFCAGPALENNTPTVFAKPTFPAKIVEERTGVSGLSVGTVSNVNNAIDSNPNNYASINMVAGILGSASISIKDALIDYPAQTYAGFDIETSSVLNLALLNNFTVRTYLDGVIQETKTGSSQLISLDSGLLLTSSERSQIGFVASKPFDEVRLTLNQPVSVNLGSTRVYGLVLEAFAEGELECDAYTVLSNPLQPVIINNTHTGIEGLLCAACEVDNATNVISESTTDFAMINVVAGVASTASIAVENVLSTFRAGTKAGFVIRDTNDLLQVDLLNSLTITTYLNGVRQERKTGTGLLALEALGLININPSQTNGFSLVGFITTLPYDELQLTVGSLVGVINSIEVYGSYVDKSIHIQGTVGNETVINASDGTLSVSASGGTPPYTYLWSPGGQTSASISGLSAGTYSVTVRDAEGCDATAEFIIYTNGVQYPVPCNTEDPVAITSTGFTDLTVAANTSGTCVVGCGILNEANIIDASTTNYAEVSTSVGVGVTHSLRVTDGTVGEFFEAGGYAGFLIENSGLLQADLLNAIQITTYLDGAPQESKISTSLIALGSSILTGGKFYVGFYTTMDYDAVEISIASLVDVISTTRVYHAVTNSFCEGPELECNTATRLTKPNFPVRVAYEHSGMGGLLTLGSINNINRAIDSNPNNYASIDLLAGVAGSASIAFKDEISDYPANTYAGFDIENASIVSTDLFDAITISTYLDGVLVESKTGFTELLPLDSGLLLTGSESMRLGFITTQPFDEVQLSMTQLVSVDLGSTRVYGMVLQSFCPAIINCDEPYVLSNPNHSVIISNNNTGTDGLACVACEVDNAINAISESNSDFALINVVAGVAGSASISVQDVLTDYPAGTAAGFVIRDTNNLLQVDLLNTLTLTTYLNGVQQEQRTAGNLLALEALGLVNITPTTTDNFYVVTFTTTTSFDEIQLTVASLVAAINSIEVYGGYVDATNTAFCQQAGIALIKQGVFNDVNNDGCTNVGETITYTYTVTNTGNGSISNVVLVDPLVGTPLSLVSGDIDGDDQLDANETWIYNFVYAVTQEDIDAGFVKGQATVTGVGPGGAIVSDLSHDNSPFENGETETILCQTAGIALIKQGNINDENNDGCSDEGETITFIITVSNEGNTTLSSVLVTDPMISVVHASGDTNGDNKLDVNETWIYTGTHVIDTEDIENNLVVNQATGVATTVFGTTISDLSHYNSVLLDDDTTVNLCQDPGIAVIKIAVFNDENDDGCSNIGETLTYTFRVTNQGNTGLQNVVLNDPLLGGTVALESGDSNNNTILDVGEVWIYTVDYTITQIDIDAGSITNQATVTAQSSLGTSVSDLSDDNSILEDDDTVTLLCQRAAIALIKEGVFNDVNGNSCSDVGETITYTFTVTNQGNVSIGTVVLNDPLLGGSVAFMSGDTDGDNVLDVNETWVYSANYIITQSNIDNGAVNNQARVTGIGINGDAVSDLSDDNSVLENDVTVTALCRSSEIALIKTAVFNDENSNGCSDVGETITYTFTVTNQGNVSIRSLAINDPLITGAITLVSGDSDSDGELDVNEAWVYTASYIVTQSDIDAGSISNQATVTGVGADGVNLSDLSDDDSVLENDSTVTALCQSSGIALIKTAVVNDEDGDGCSDAGETITYTFTVTNQGNSSIRSLAINDPLVTSAISLVAGDFDADDELDVNETWLYTAIYTITQSDIEAGSISNQATVTGVGADGINLSDLSDDDNILENDFTVTDLCQSEGIALIKTAVFNDENNNSCSDIGETITYTFTVTNQGNTAIEDILLTDSMLASMTLTSGDVNMDNRLDVGETWIYYGVFTLTDLDINSGVISNQATVEGVSVATGNAVADISDDDSVLEDDPTVTTLCAVSSISLEKVGVFNDENGNGTAQVGETVTYTFSVYNTGQTTLSNITIQDDVLPGIVVQGGPIGQLLPGAVDNTTYTATYTIRQEDIVSLRITNQALVTAVDSSGNTITDISDDPTNLDDIDIDNDGDPDDPTVTDLPDPSDDDFRIFNAMSPDGDGQNDFFRIEGIENYPDNSLKIYNRWGVLIYEAEAYGINGKVFRGISEGRATISKNEALPTGTYFYILTRRIVNQDALINKGYLYIKRN